MVMGLQLLVKQTLEGRSDGYGPPIAWILEVPILRDEGCPHGGPGCGNMATVEDAVEQNFEGGEWHPSYGLDGEPVRPRGR
ncbi:hypothetical protein QE152_g41641, partial [Popillia japonica]